MTADVLLPRVLVVDDDRDNVRLVERILHADFEVVGFTSPAAALRELERSSFDLVIADQRMPKISGTELLERVLRLQPFASRVILSGFTETDDLLTAINRCRIHRFLTKPVTKEALLACARALTMARAGDLNRCLVVGTEGDRAQQLTKELRAIAGSELTVSASTNTAAATGNTLVVLVEPSIDQVQTVVAQMGGADRRAVIFVLMPTGAVQDAAFFLRAGVEDVIWPPHHADEIILRYRTWRARRNAEAEADRLRAELVSRQGYFEIIGQSSVMQAVFEAIERVAQTETNVLLCGETGTGKELVARAIHAASQRHDAPFCAVNLSAVPETLLETELFGHEAGAFTGATRPRPGRMEIVSGGSLFLDEVGDLVPAVQVKLLRVLEERRYQRVGSSVTRTANFRLVCATHQDLNKLVEEGLFREDLFYRLNVIRIDLPPLRDRLEDVPLLARAFLERHCRQAGKKGISLGDKAMAELMSHDWPGNVRELEHTIERAVALSSGGELEAGLLVDRTNRKSFRGMVDSFVKGGRTLDELLDDVERTVLLETMQRFEGNQSAMARKLRIPRTTLRSRLKKHNL